MLKLAVDGFDRHRHNLTRLLCWREHGGANVSDVAIVGNLRFGRVGVCDRNGWRRIVRQIDEFVFEGED